MRITLCQENVARILEEGANRARTAARLASACEAIKEKILLQVSLEDAANLAGIERSYFCRVFKKHMGIGFAVWLREIRVAYAKDLLSRPEVRITDIALMCGFSDLSSFDRFFRNSVGFTPRRYRRALQQGNSTSLFLDFHAGF